MIEKIIKENKDKSIINKNCQNFVLFSIVLFLGLPFAFVAAYFLAFYGRVYQGVQVCQQSFSGKNEKEVIDQLNLIVQEKKPKIINLVYGSTEYRLNPQFITYSSEKTADKLLRVGRDKIFPFNIPEVFQLLKNSKNYSLEFKINNEDLDSQLASRTAELNESAIDPEIKIVNNNSKKEVIIETGKDGQEVDSRRLKNMLVDNFGCPSERISIQIPIVPVFSKITVEMGQATKERATSLLGKKVILKSEENKWEVNDEEIINFLSFTGGFNRAKILTFAEEMVKVVNSLPENASFRFENNKVTLFKPAKDGLTLKESELTENLLSKLNQLEQSGQDQELELSTLKTPPKISNSDVNSLGINELLAKGGSLFFGSIQERIHNVNLASQKLNGILIPPGEEFSFNRSLGDVSSDTGFKQAYIIKEGRTILGDGGGVCQVSTTLFRAALNAGLPITERHAHAYRVHYYEDDLGPGFDATVFDPNANLKFINNTPAHILIQSTIDTKNKKLVFEIYGTNDNRKVEISKVRVWDKLPPSPDLYQDDPTLLTGVIKQVDWKAWGAKAAFDYKVTKGNEILEQKTFTSVYRPWQAVYLRGTRG